ncbi:MAG: TetR/AcrR family transcriptional regulator [Acidimicrobiales bacterium]
MPTDPTDPSAHSRGRPRDPERSRAILDAARALLHDGGWAALTVEAAASRAGVGRPTVYRRWPTKGHLVAEVLGAELSELGGPDEPRGLAVPDTGSLRGDLLALMRAHVERLAVLEKHGVLPGLLAEMALDAELAERVQDEVLRPDRSRLTVIVDAAAERGDAPADLDIDLVMNLLGGSVVYQTFVLHREVDDRTLERLVDVVATGCRP